MCKRFVESKRVLVCGDREWVDTDAVMMKRLAKLPLSAVVIHGACRGADRCAGTIALGYSMAIETYPADWKRYGKGAGPIRNQQMLDTGIDLVLAFHNDIENSSGTADMVARATSFGIPVEIYTCTS